MSNVPKNGLGSFILYVSSRDVVVLEYPDVSCIESAELQRFLPEFTSIFKLKDLGGNWIGFWEKYW